MIIKRQSGLVKGLLFISNQDDLDLEITHPSIPVNFLVTGKYMDWQTKRTRLYENVSDALSALWLGQKIKGSELYVYEAQGIRSESLIKPSITSAPYTLVIPEWWYLANVRFKKLGKIKVEKEIGKDWFTYGPRATKSPIYRWSWSEILKSWEKPKIKKD